MSNLLKNWALIGLAWSCLALIFLVVIHYNWRQLRLLRLSLISAACATAWMALVIYGR